MLCCISEISFKSFHFEANCKSVSSVYARGKLRISFTIYSLPQGFSKACLSLCFIYMYVFMYIYVLYNVLYVAAIYMKVIKTKNNGLHSRTVLKNKLSYLRRFYEDCGIVGMVVLSSFVKFNKIHYSDISVIFMYLFIFFIFHFN